MSPSEPVEDAIDPLRLCLGKLTSAMALRPLHLRGSGRVPNSTQNQSRYSGPIWRGVPKTMGLLGAKKLSELPGASFEYGGAEVVAQSHK